MIRTNGPPAHRARALGAAAAFVGSLAVTWLALGSASADAATAPRALAAPDARVHGPYSRIADQCATCHRAHTGKASYVLRSPVPQSALCFTCHDGSGANANVQAQYDDPLVPSNNPATREYYRHDALVTTSHTRAELNEFGGVSNRHNECGDCHNAHDANSTDSTQTATGWTAPGRIASTSGVSVVNGAAGTPPTYTFLAGSTTPITREYQLCFKCHSGFTTLPSNAGLPPSKHLLDKGVEFNPNNASYHPVEAPGKNGTPKMAASLAGASPFRQWSFTTGSTIRCSNCHASSDRFNLTTPPSAGGDLAPHASQYRGILLRNYQNRVLKSSTAAYSNADFALCYTCHATSPFATSGDTTATNFRLHRLHVAQIAGEGTGGTNIDTAGAGAGNAICAECHFRLHSTTFKSGTQSVPGSRLVNFAPNVQPSGGTLSWAPGANTGSGSCTLTCHGKSHNGEGY